MIQVGDRVRVLTPYFELIKSAEATVIKASDPEFIELVFDDPGIDQLVRMKKPREYVPEKGIGYSIQDYKLEVIEHAGG